ncbi:MAG TPA: hypothetical protein VD996_12445, partial [Chitinophagaceae bacterium]|nr:hypothetical protein [Chitinophagaceae bacterium]
KCQGTQYRQLISFDALLRGSLKVIPPSLQKQNGPPRLGRGCLLEGAGRLACNAVDSKKTKGTKCRGSVLLLQNHPGITVSNPFQIFKLSIFALKLIHEAIH